MPCPSRLLAALCLGLPSLAGCSFDGRGHEGRICTMEYRTETARVLDAARVPVEDASVEVLRVSTGRSIACAAETERGCLRLSTYRPGSEGRYEVVNDGVTVAPRGEDFRVVATPGRAGPRPCSALATTAATSRSSPARTRSPSPPDRLVT